MSNSRSILLTYIKRKEWKRTIDRANSHPHEVAQHDATAAYSVGTILHMACFQDPPDSTPRAVISCLLSAHPAAVTMKNQHGDTPLHHAIRYSSTEVIECLLTESPHAAEMTSIKNHYGWTPLQWLCYPQGTIDLALKRPLLVDQSGMEFLERDERLLRIWSRACLLVKAAAIHSKNAIPNGNEHDIEEEEEEDFYVVHACASMQGCPDALFQLAIKLHPMQLHQLDADGNFPLTVTIQSGKKWHGDMRNVGVKSVLEGNPAALASLEIMQNDPFFPVILEFLGCESSLSTLYQCLRQVPQLMAPTFKYEKRNGIELLPSFEKSALLDCCALS